MGKLESVAIGRREEISREARKDHIVRGCGGIWKGWGVNQGKRSGGSDGANPRADAG